jgi:hypothetical protein
MCLPAASKVYTNSELDPVDGLGNPCKERQIGLEGLVSELILPQAISKERSFQLDNRGDFRRCRGMILWGHPIREGPQEADQPS